MEKRCEYYKNIDEDAKDKLHQAEELKNEYAEKLRLADNEIEENRRLILSKKCFSIEVFRSLENIIEYSTSTMI